MSLARLNLHPVLVDHELLFGRPFTLDFGTAIQLILEPEAIDSVTILEMKNALAILSVVKPLSFVSTFARPHKLAITLSEPIKPLALIHGFVLPEASSKTLSLSVREFPLVLALICGSQGILSKLGWRCSSLSLNNIWRCEVGIHDRWSSLRSVLHLEV